MKKNLYEDFHGARPIRERMVDLPEPKGKLIKIGKLVRLEYEPDYPSQYQGTRFYHNSGDTGTKKLKTNLILCTDEEGKNLFLIKANPKAKHPYFSERGIIG